MPTANEILRDQAVLHAVLLQQLQRGHLLELDALFTGPAREAIRAAMGPADQAARVLRSAEVPGLVQAIMGSYVGIVAQAHQGVVALGNETAQAEAAWWNAGAGLPAELVALLPWAQVSSNPSAGSAPALGLPPAEWASNLVRDYARQADNQLRSAAGLQETAAAGTARLLRANDNLARVGTERMARTVARSSANQVERTWHQANQQLLKSWRWLATLDSATCQVCGGRDGTEWPPDGGPDMPAHPRCRCVREPVLVSWRELGIPMDDVPSPWRASMDGRAVPGELTYDDWLRTTSVANQQLALGPRRWDVWVSQGRPSVSRYVDGDRVLTLDEIIALS